MERFGISLIFNFSNFLYFYDFIPMDKKISYFTKENEMKYNNILCLIGNDNDKKLNRALFFCLFIDINMNEELIKLKYNFALMYSEM